MPEPITEPTDRVGAKNLKRIDELERIVKALIKGMKEAEDATGEALMPAGDYYGIKFED